MTSIILLGQVFSGAAAILAVVIFVYIVFEYILYLQKEKIKNITKKTTPKKQGTLRKFIYGRQHGRCVGSRKIRKKIIRKVKKGK